MLVDGIADVPGPALGCAGSIQPTLLAAASGLSATAGNASASLSWDAPASNGAQITGYQVRWYAAGASSPTGSMAAR